MTWEHNLLNWIDRVLHGSDFINTVIKQFSALNDIGLLWITIGVILLISKKYRKCGLLMLITLLFGWILNDLILKNVIGRPRPFEVNDQLKIFVYNIYEEKESLGFLNKILGNKVPSLGKSMPSGHSFISFNAATCLFMINKKKFAVPAYIIAALTALSRVFLCVHYPTDILVGSLLGALTGFGSFHFFGKFFGLKKDESICA